MNEAEPTKYPPYACNCCGVTNGDMFWDYIESNASTLTYAAVKDLCEDFDSYRANWHRHNEEVSNAIKAGKKLKPRHRAGAIR